VPFVLYSAQNIHKRYPVPFRWLERLALRPRHRCLGVCNSEAGRILRCKGLGAPAPKIPLGVDIAQLTRADRPAPARPMRIGYVGRLEPHKGVDVLLRALPLPPDSTLAIAGAGLQERQLRRLADEICCTKRVTFAGPPGQGRSGPALPAA
jgi:glycosyltransferase involved in cell wall biosynthesis